MWSPQSVLYTRLVSYRLNAIDARDRFSFSRLPTSFLLSTFYLLSFTSQLPTSNCDHFESCNSLYIGSRPYQTPPQYSRILLPRPSVPLNYPLETTWVLSLSSMMNSTSVQSVQFSPIKDGRRILGEKDSNACLSPATHAKPSFPAIGTPVKRISIATSPKKLLPSPIFAGQKRTRDQLEEMEENLGHVQTRESSPQPGVQSTVNDDMQNQVSSCETDKEVPGMISLKLTLNARIIAHPNPHTTKLTTRTRPNTRSNRHRPIFQCAQHPRARNT